MMNPVALLLLIVVAACATQGQARTHRKTRIGTAIPNVNFCDFTVHPKRYAGKLVRVKATLVAWWESSYLYSPDCETDEKKIHNGLDCTGKRECERVGNAINHAIERVGKPAEYDSYKADLVLIGRLVGPSRIGFGHLNGFKYEFRIRSAEGQLKTQAPAGSLTKRRRTNRWTRVPTSRESMFRMITGRSRRVGIE